MKYKLRRAQVIQPIDQSIKLIALTRGQVATVDAADFEWLNDFNWYAWWNPSTKSFYAMRNPPGGIKERRGFVAMHREILKMSDPSMEVDHRNRDTLDNRKQNLRRATKVQNQANSCVHSHSSSGLKGAIRARDKWAARIRWQGRNLYLGIFKTPEEAHAAYLVKAVELHGEFAARDQR